MALNPPLGPQRRRTPLQLLPWLGVVMLALTGCARTQDPGDLRGEARLILAAAEQAEGTLTLADVMGPSAEGISFPPLIRVWRRGLDGSRDSCEGRVDLLELEDYVAGVLPSEWMPGWKDAALDAGSIAARTYGAFWVQAGGRYTCADVDDTTWTQVYRDVRHPNTDAAVKRTAGAVAIRDDSLVFAEYSAENGHPTATGVQDTICQGQRVKGHGRGMCQWGTQRWASRGHQADWMVAHYYPGASIAWADEALNAGISVRVDSGERFSLSLQVANPGPEAWPPGAWTVRTDSAVFQDETWPDPETAWISDAPISAGSIATLRWWMRAPEVPTQEEIPAFFWLEGPEIDAPGTSGSWHITVSPPQPPEVVTPEEDPPAPWMWIATFLGSLALGGAGLVRLLKRSGP